MFFLEKVQVGVSIQNKNKKVKLSYESQLFLEKIQVSRILFHWKSQFKEIKYQHTANSKKGISMLLYKMKIE